MPFTRAQADPIAAFQTDLDASEERLIRGLDWLTYNAATHRDAIVQSNVLMRLFLSSGRLHAARTLLLGLPADVLAAIDDEETPEVATQEHLHYVAFFDALAAHLRYAEVWSERPAEK